MSKQDKFAGSFGKVGDTASGGSAINGNVYQSARRAGAAPMAAIKPNVAKDSISLSGRNNAVVQERSSTTSHNDINTFTRGIKSRGPYGGPSFGSFNNTKQNYQSKNTSSISKFSTPSAKGGKKGGSGYMA